MLELGERRSVLMEKNRMESLTDWIPAFAMTLRVNPDVSGYWTG